MKLLPRESSQCDAISEAHSRIEEVAAYINEKQEKAEQQNKVMEVCLKVEGCKDVMSPTRKLIRSGTLLSHEAQRLGTTKQKVHHFYLFNDILIVSRCRRSGATAGLSMSTPGTAEKLIFKIQLKECQITNLEDCHFQLRFGEDLSKSIICSTSTMALKV